jgi:hypothetical protein
MGRPFLHFSNKLQNFLVNGIEIPIFGPPNSFRVEFAPFSSSFCFLQRRTFGSATLNFRVVAQLLVSYACLITINLKLRRNSNALILVFEMPLHLSFQNDHQ